MMNILQKSQAIDATHKTCTLCSRTLPISQLVTGHICRPCYNKRVAARLRATKQKAAKYKGGKCIVCGYTRCIDALEFHHIRGEKDFTISHKCISFEKLVPELDKCILVCARCHREIHANLVFIDKLGSM